MSEETLTIETGKCIAYWQVDPTPLPVFRPYMWLGKYRDYCDNVEPEIGTFSNEPIPAHPRHSYAIEAGGVSRWRFKYETVTLDYTMNTHLWVLGFVRYRDRLTKHRLVFFGSEVRTLFKIGLQQAITPIMRVKIPANSGLSRHRPVRSPSLTEAFP